MGPSSLIKHAREKKGWTQRQVANAIGVTPGFITKVESEQALPSYERCIALAGVLDVPFDRLWAEVEKARVEAHQQSIYIRGAAVRGTLRTPGVLAGPPTAPPALELSAADIARDMASDAELRAAYRDLKFALADPQLRETVLNALRVFARAAHSSS
jgi:transcriptional regulator with XRE-family HTH domain